MIFKILAFLDLFAVSLIVPSLGSHFINNDIVWIASIYGIAQFFSQPFFGRLADRIGIKNTILLCLSVSSLSYLILSLTVNPWLVMISRILAGTFKQTQELSRLAIVNSTPKSERTKTIGLFNAIGSAGFIIGPTIGGHIREYFPTHGFAYCAQLTSSLFFVNCLIVFVFMKTSNRTPKNPVEIKVEQNNNQQKPTILGVLTSLWDLCVVRLFLTMAILMARYVIPILTERAFGPAKSGYVTSFTALVGTLSASMVSFIIPKILERMTVAMAESNVIWGCASTLILISSSWNSSPNWFLFLSFLSLNCLFTQASRILLTELTVQRCPEDIRGYALGTVTSLTAVSRAICDVMLAFLLQFGDLMPIYLGAVLTLLAGSITVLYSAKKLKTD